jgi:ribosome recycling factor
VLHQKLEQGRIAIRQIREDVKKMIDAAEKDGDMPQDEKFKQQEALDKMVKEYNDMVKTIGEEKEKEITTV